VALRAKHSVARGNVKGFHDSRGNVFLTFIHLIIELQPQFAVIENVRGLLSAPLKHRPHLERGKGYPPLTTEEKRGVALLYVLNLLRSAGYGISFNLYNSANFGSPQSRERVIILCSRDGKRLPYLAPTHSEDGQYGLPKWRTLRDALDELPKDGHQHVKFPEKRLRYYRMLKPGQNWRCLPPELQKEALGKSYFAGGGKTGFYRRLDWDKPSPTLVTHPAMPATDLAHPEEERPLSIQEYKRIQEIPDDWLIAGSLVEQYKQIGNAVPCSLGRAVGRTLIAHLHGRDISAVPHFPYSRYQNTDDVSWEQEVTAHSGNSKEQQLTLIYEPGQGASLVTPDTSRKVAMSNSGSGTTPAASTMTEKEVLDVIFRESKVKRSSLLAECVYSIDKYLEIEEDELREIAWVDKKGSPEQMIKDDQIESLINHRNAYLRGIPEDKHIEKIREMAASFAHFPVLKGLLKNFVPTKKASTIAEGIERIESIDVNAHDFTGLLNNLTREERENVNTFFSQRSAWSYEFLGSLDKEVGIFTESLKLKAKFLGLDSSILDDEKLGKLKIFVLNNWFSFFEDTNFFNSVQEAGYVEN
jgi:site-specific DNA-cytosine methylase